MHKFRYAAQTACMGKKNSKKIIEKIYEGTASANECTGALQKISLDPDEVALFHAEYVWDIKE